MVTVLVKSRQSIRFTRTYGPTITLPLWPLSPNQLRGAPTRPNCSALNCADETSVLDLAESSAKAVGSTKAEASVVAAAVEIVWAGAAIGVWSTGAVTSAGAPKLVTCGAVAQAAKARTGRTEK